MAEVAFVRQTAGGCAWEAEALDVNDSNAVTGEFALGNCTLVTVFVEGVTGTHASHELTVEVSPDNVFWVQTPIKVTGADTFIGGDLVAEFMRLSVSNTEGSASTVNVYVVAR